MVERAEEAEEVEEAQEAQGVQVMEKALGVDCPDEGRNGRGSQEPNCAKVVNTISMSWRLSRLDALQRSYSGAYRWQEYRLVWAKEYCMNLAVTHLPVRRTRSQMIFAFNHESVSFIRRQFRSSL